MITEPRWKSYIVETTTPVFTPEQCNKIIAAGRAEPRKNAQVGNEKGTKDGEVNLVTDSKLEKNFLIQADWVIGCAMLINMDKFPKKKIFDEKIFIYFDEFDACYNVIKNGGKVFSSKILLIKHLGNKGSLAADQNYKEITDNFRDWHWMWSQFYFYKKNYSIIYALKKYFFRLIKLFLAIFIYKVLRNKQKFNNTKYKFLGLYNSMIGKDSFYRLED